MDVVSLLIGLAFVVFWVWLVIRILGKAGHSVWWVLILFVPLVNLVMVWVFAFSRWPAVDGPAAAVAPAQAPPSAPPGT